MTKPIYTAIPDTSDTDYWIRTVNEQDRSITFVPKDKELHRQLKQKARKLNPPTYRDRNKKE